MIKIVSRNGELSEADKIKIRLEIVKSLITINPINSRHTEMMIDRLVRYIVSGSFEPTEE